MDRTRPTRDRSAATAPLPHRVKSLFHSPTGANDLNKKRYKLIHTNPNVYLIRHFLNHGEIEYFNKQCTFYARSFQPSFTENSSTNGILSDERTSKYIHLTKSQDKVSRTIEQRASDLVGLSEQCVEPLQIVSYSTGQKFDLHHDAGTLLENNEIELVSPRRIVTLFVYLNNLPLGNGHTEFPALNLSVQPQAGSAVMFCNLDADGRGDSRVVHQANPIVVDGLRKYGLNIWICDKYMPELVHAPVEHSVSKIKNYDYAYSEFARAQYRTAKHEKLKREQSAKMTSSSTAGSERGGCRGPAESKNTPSAAPILTDGNTASNSEIEKRPNSNSNPNPDIDDEEPRPSIGGEQTSSRSTPKRARAEINTDTDIDDAIDSSLAGDGGGDYNGIRDRVGDTGNKAGSGGASVDSCDYF